MIKSHMGKIIEGAIKKSGKSVKQIANELGISRNALYCKFKLPYIRKDFILRLSAILHYDFTKEIPDMLEYSKEFESYWGDLEDKEELNFANKYIILLEKYNQLLMFLIRISSSKNIDCIKKEIVAFVKDKGYT